ncbi:MAG TPA: hypothetical protein VJ943_03400 [Desulfotignum sp.]|nr:hypothetical protein [Desulfotignum sp.]
MDMKKLAPWNWFKKETENIKNICLPLRFGRLKFSQRDDWGSYY